jgi:uncharacterized protein (UPF0305 family)
MTLSDLKELAMAPNAKELAELLREEIIPEIEEYMDELFEKIATVKKAGPEDKSEYEELRELRDNFLEMLKDVEEGEMEETECAELIDEIEAMRDLEEEEA